MSPRAEEVPEGRADRGEEEHRIVLRAQASDSGRTYQAAGDINVFEAGPGTSVTEIELDRVATESTARTRSLVASLTSYAPADLTYRPPSDAIGVLTSFLESPSRVFVLKGPPGSGKTALTYHLADRMGPDVSFQLHSADSWDLPRFELAAEILRYASVPRSDDSLLTLERAGVRLDRPCVVVVDGIASQSRFDAVALQVDRILRQVTTPALRFLLVVRTPPDIEMSAYPVLSATVYSQSAARPRGTSYQLVPWSTAEARVAWNQSRKPRETVFSELPAAVRQLARLPLYMKLLKAAGLDSADGEINGYRLVDHCVAAVLPASGHDRVDLSEALADAALQATPELVPSPLRSLQPASSQPTSPFGVEAPPLVHSGADGAPVFIHDVVREYFLATRITALLEDQGRSSSTVTAVNELAKKAMGSAAARGVFEFTVYGLDRSAPDLLAAVMVSPAVHVGSTLPLVLGLVARGGVRFADEHVLRVCTRRCRREASAELAKSLLAVPAVADALAAEYAPWLAELLRQFGPAVWPQLVTAIERSLDAQGIRRLLNAVDLRHADEATFFARYYYVFLSSEADSAAESLDTFLEHPDWRVRAALADGIRDKQSPRAESARIIMDRLAYDADYKVRAAAARAIGQAGSELAEHHLGALLTDDNWHVRSNVLQGLLSGSGEPADARPATVMALDLLRSEPGWQQCPAQIATHYERLLLLSGVPGRNPESAGRTRALFELLREARTGWTSLAGEVRDTLVAEGLSVPSWLVRREAKAFARPYSGSGAVSSASSLAAPSPPDAYRRLRGGRSIQIALDLHDLDQAVEVARAVAAAGAEFIEVGDPLIKTVGVTAVERIKRAVPNTTVVAEMMSADWGRDQVVLAAEYGADVVFLIGPATTASVSAAVDAGRRLGVPILLDVPSGHASAHWIADMEQAGVDGFAITTNIDIGVGSNHPLARSQALRSWTRLPVAVSGGFSSTDRTVLRSPEWDVLIVGRSVTEATHPTTAARLLTQLIHQPE
ncbi:orotidine 5'-phosphate decarboxylase / HUMPS family protein [Streptomyces sp. AC558_RSS880]|uniref:orotidine 5'-phosphate decarboxylase / HUMPS family protein n=1 Tax=Streptomyces sp. AC558_RSS880 TaxID=2823687 RepID=UPI001C214896|nr:orotidine 5'-phosphate decarboxylase / HUMPS family protein [Streptomyces sp. AC558_RSS880]